MQKLHMHNCHLQDLASLLRLAPRAPSPGWHASIMLLILLFLFLHHCPHVTGLAATSAKQQTMLDDLHSMSSRDQAALEQVQHTSARGQAHVQGM